MPDRPVYLIAAGKASPAMAQAVLDYYGDSVLKGLVVRARGTGRNVQGAVAGRIETFDAEHPLPGKGSARAGEALTEFIGKLPVEEESTVLFCISGGGSSLVCRSGEGISAPEIHDFYQVLINSGLDIQEVNTVRKHVSRIKGGQLLRHIPRGARDNVGWYNLVISDVPGDDPAVIGSGPAVPDDSTYQEAYHILLEHGLWDTIPESVKEHIEKGLLGTEPGMVREGDIQLGHFETRIVGSASILAQEIARQARKRGYNTLIENKPYSAGVREVATRIFSEIMDTLEGKGPITLPAALVFFGESTVEVSGQGKGGRNQELALWGANKLALLVPRESDDADAEQGVEITWLSAGTDGIDGPTNAAGAVISQDTLQQAKELGLDPVSFLEDNDSYHFHEQVGTLLKTGPTGNNLMDVQLVLLASSNKK